VEFAIIAPLLFMLVFGIINFGLILGQQLALNHAVREAARAAVVESTGKSLTTTAALQSKVQANAVMAGMSSGSITLANTPGSCPTKKYGQDLTLKATYPSVFLVPMLVPGLNAPVLKAQASFRCEWE
jgi:Flp pilus assembly protein TadG